MLCTAKSDTFSTKFAGFLSISWCISICTNFHSSVLVSPSHDSSEFTCDCSVYSRDDTVIDVTCRTIQRDCISFMVFFSSQCKSLVFFVHCDIATTGYTASSHTTGNYCCMGCHTTTNCQDTLSRCHTGDIFRRCLQTNQNYFFSSCSPFYSVISCEYDFTASSSR